ncbi:MAG: hypothetical protein ACI4JB_11830 [Porcipelethomonas sp.]
MEENKKTNLKIFIPILAVLICMISSVAYIVFRMSSNRVYEEKWKDYDECGI